jgi:peptide/nickel transport system permease protein
MGQYLIRRLLIAIPSLLGISVILFCVLALAPGDPFEELATNPAVPPEVRAALRVKFGLDDPVSVRYVRWLAAMAHGDWGYSFVSRMQVDTLILQRLPTTLFVIGTSQVLALLIAIPVGVYAATRP